MTHHVNDAIDYAELYRRTIPSVVSIYADGTDPRRPRGAGSGFVYDGTHLVTNAHVVREERTVEVRFSEGEWRTGRVVGVDEATDLAVVAVDDLPEYAGPLPVAGESPDPGEPVAALGNPMGLDGTVSTGVVSGTNRSMRIDGGFTIPDTVQTDAPINPGNSGGPLVSARGRDDATDPDTDGGAAGPPPAVVGVNRARGGDNIGFAVSPRLVSRVVPELIDQGEASHATLHVSTLDVSPAVAEANGVDPVGVLVVDVRPGPASGVLGGCTGTRQVGDREVPVGGDVIVGIDGRALRSHEELTRYLMAERRPGDEVELRVRRRAGDATERVTLADRERSGEPPRGARIGID